MKRKFVKSIETKVVISKLLKLSRATLLTYDEQAGVLIALSAIQNLAEYKR